ncbi:MAG: hypothetical protein BMS9Abin05_0446 [Rhodothermia bacterium]|nr:MAG: hypothetical protein BMS9Abin05_0446 [Rhodothermia bacterium]
MISLRKEDSMKIQNNSFSILLASVLIVATGCASTQETIQAMHDWEKGHTVSYELVQNQNQILEIPGQGTQENPGSTTIDISVAATGPYQYTFSVTDAEAVGARTPISALIGLESAVVLEPNGRIVTASGLADNAYVAAAGGAEQFKESLQEIFLILPDEPLAAGVSWTRESSVPFAQMGLEGMRESTAKYRSKRLTMYKGVSAFEIEVSSDVSLIGSGNQGGGEMEITMDGTLDGILFVDASSGTLLNSEQSGEITGMIDMAQMSIPIILELTRITSIVE